MHQPSSSDLARAEKTKTLQAQETRRENQASQLLVSSGESHDRHKAQRFGTLSQIAEHGRPGPAGSAHQSLPSRFAGKKSPFRVRLSL